MSFTIPIVVNQDLSTLSALSHPAQITPLTAEHVVHGDDLLSHLRELLLAAHGLAAH